MMIREKYLKAIRGFYDCDLVKVITGVKGSGKSVILKTIINEIKINSDNIIYLDFENTSDFSQVSNTSKLIKYVKDKRNDGL